MVSAAEAADVLVQRDGGVALVTLNRPDKLNALTPQMQLRYVELLRELDADPQVRVVVVTGAGRGFCSGADVAALADTEKLLSFAPDVEQLPTVALGVRKPVVAAVNGPVAGIGFALMLACDVRFVAAQARIGTTFSRLGLVAEYGTSWLLPRIVGTSRALELLLSGRAVDADEALRIGLVDQVPEATAHGLFYGASACMYWLHTRAADGLIESQSPVPRRFTLGELFAIWNQPLTRRRVAAAHGVVTALVNGRRWRRSPAAIPLTANASIELAVGRPVPKPTRVDWVGTGF